MWHAFANALIGSAHIENAAITNAKIHNLTADKIRSAEIKGQDIQVGLGGGVAVKLGALASMVLLILEKVLLLVETEASFLRRTTEGYTLMMANLY